jgi:AcrR family transcriptional regulator
MPRSGEQTQQRILGGAYRLFRQKGYARVSMDEIADGTDVTKRTLYYHFESKDALLAAVLENQHQLALAAFRTFGDQLSGSAIEIVDAMFKDLAVWADTPRWAGSGFTRLVVELADLPGHPARRIARQHKALLEEQFAALLRRSGVRDARACAREIWLLSEGAISLMLVHGDKRYAAAAARAAKKLLANNSVRKTSVRRARP